MSKAFIIYSLMFLMLNSFESFGTRLSPLSNNTKVNLQSNKYSVVYRLKRLIDIFGENLSCPVLSKYVDYKDLKKICVSLCKLDTSMYKVLSAVYKIDRKLALAIAYACSCISKNIKEIDRVKVIQQIQRFLRYYKSLDKEVVISEDIDQEDIDSFVQGLYMNFNQTLPAQHHVDKKEQQQKQEVVHGIEDKVDVLNQVSGYTPLQRIRTTPIIPIVTKGVEDMLIQLTRDISGPDIKY